MREVADRVFQIALFPRNTVNAYLVGSVLIDAGVRTSASNLRRALRGHTLAAHALTHAHADHQGASAAICQHYGVPLWCGERDKGAAESGFVVGEYPHPDGLMARLQQRFWAGPGYPVARTLREGDTVGDFVVLETPGHASGHVSYWRERDRVLIAGDVLVNMDMRTTLPGLHEPPVGFTSNIARNRQSIHRLAALNPATVCFGHGPVVHNTGQLQQFAARLPKDVPAQTHQ